MENKIIEINGMKMEIDARTAKLSQVDTFKVGDKVRLLVKKYSDSYDTHAGIIVGFDNFKERPTIRVAYLDGSYSPELKFASINKDSGHEMVLTQDEDISLNKDMIVSAMDRDIAEKEKNLANAIEKKNYFLRHFMGAEESANKFY